MLDSAKRAARMAGVLAVAAFGLAACGGSSNGGAGSQPNGATGSARASEPFVGADAAAAIKQVTGFEPFTKAATAAELGPRVAAYGRVPSKLLIDQPVSKKATPGKRLAILYTGVPIAIEYFNAQKAAARLLGWKVTGVDVGTSPQDFGSAYNRAIALKPDMVIGSGLPREFFSKQLDTLQKMNVPVIEWSSGVKPVTGHVWVAVDNPLYQAGAIQMSEYLAASGDMKAKVVAFNVKQFAMIDVFTRTMDQYMTKMCPSCSYDLQQVAATDIGKLAQKVTGYVQQHPETNYVLCGFGDLCQGVGTALRAAGRKDIKIVTRDPASTNYQNIHNGIEWGAGALPIAQTSWQVIDLAQRIFNGDDTSKTRLMPQQIITKVPDPKDPLLGAVPDYQTQYKALWKLSG